MLVLEDEVIRRKREGGVDGAIGGSNFNGLCAWKSVLRLHDEGELTLEKNIVPGTEGDGQRAVL